MTFKQYILNPHETDDPRGDFIGDVKHDKNSRAHKTKKVWKYREG